MAKFIRKFYNNYPVFGNVLVYGSLYSAGDITQQIILNKPRDLSNTKRIGAVGGGLFGPINTYWYRFLEGRLPGTATKTVAKKILADQGVYGPIGIGLFYTGKMLFCFT